jgi:MATE family multidrug resistance protein
VLRASGRQAWGAGVNLIGYWIIGVPLGAYLGFSQGMAVQGFWLGVGTSAVLQALALGVMVARWDWQGEVRRAQERLASGTFAAAGGH